MCLDDGTGWNGTDPSCGMYFVVYVPTFQYCLIVIVHQLSRLYHPYKTCKRYTCTSITIQTVLLRLNIRPSLFSCFYLILMHIITYIQI